MIYSVLNQLTMGNDNGKLLKHIQELNDQINKYEERTSELEDRVNNALKELQEFREFTNQAFQNMEKPIDEINKRTKRLLDQDDEIYQQVKKIKYDMNNRPCCKKYKTIMCRNGRQCTYSNCIYAHFPEELNKSYQDIYYP